MFKKRGIPIAIFILMISSTLIPFMPTGATSYGKDILLEGTDASYFGEYVNDQAGYRVKNACDFNGDGRDDILVSSFVYDEGAANRGKVYIVYGKGTGWTTNNNISTADVSFIGKGPSDFLGISIDCAGDVNGDGYEDIIMGAYQAHELSNRHGAAYIMFGGNEWGTNVSVSNANVTYVGEVATDNAGWSVAGAGDVNGDGFGDVIIGAKNSDKNGNNAGQIYVVFGKSGGWPETPKQLDQVNASYLGEQPNDNAGYYIDGAGDVNGDGFDDFLIGAMSNDEYGNNAGMAYLILGKNSGWSMHVNLSNADIKIHGSDESDYLGACVSTAGDFNNDGYDDFMVGAYLADSGGPSQKGAVYLILGSKSLVDSPFDVKDSDKILWGESHNDRLGWHGSCSEAGDVNGDRYDDIILGAPENDEQAGNAGQAYLILGTNSLIPKSENVGGAATSSWLGQFAVELGGKGTGGGGDFDGDGYDDIVVSAPEKDYWTSQHTGKTYVIFPDSNDPPESISSINIYSDPDYSQHTVTAEMNDTPPST